MKVLILTIVSICLINNTFANHNLAKDCQLYPVEISDGYDQWYGSGGSYRQDTYSLKISLKIDRSKLDGDVKRVGFTYVNDETSGTLELTRSNIVNQWELSLDYYKGGFYGYRQINWEGSFFVETENNQYYWLQSSSYENLAIEPRVELGPSSYHKLKLVDGEIAKLFNQLDVYNCAN